MLVYGVMLFYFFILGWVVDLDFVCFGLFVGVILMLVWLFDCWWLLVRLLYVGCCCGGGFGVVLVMMVVMVLIVVMVVMIVL